MNGYQDFVAAKKVLRAHPGWSDAEVAEQLQIKDSDTQGMSTIREARRDLEAGDHTRPDILP